MSYIGTPPGAIDGLMKRDFAPAASRLRSVIARLKAAPAMFGALRANVADPPKEFTDLAIGMGAGSIGFFQRTVRDWARNAAGNDAELLREFNAANDAVVKLLTRDRGLDEARPAANISREIRPRHRSVLQEVALRGTGRHPRSIGCWLSARPTSGAITRPSAPSRRRSTRRRRRPR